MEVSLRRSPVAFDLVPHGGLWWWNSKHLPVPLFSGDPETLMDKTGTQIDLLKRISDVRILDLLCNKKVMSCPFAGKDCAGEIQTCKEGFSDPGTFPTKDCILQKRYRPLGGTTIAKIGPKVVSCDALMPTAIFVRGTAALFAEFRYTKRKAGTGCPSRSSSAGSTTRSSASICGRPPTWRDFQCQ